MALQRRGTDVLGDGEVIAVRIKNARELASGQGRLAAFVTSILPETVEREVNKKVASELQVALKSRGADADVFVTSGLAGAVRSSPSFTHGVVAGAVGVGALYGIWKFVVRGLFFPESASAPH